MDATMRACGMRKRRAGAGGRGGSKHSAASQRCFRMCDGIQRALYHARHKAVPQHKTSSLPCSHRPSTCSIPSSPSPAVACSPATRMSRTCHRPPRPTPLSPQRPRSLQLQDWIATETTTGWRRSSASWWKSSPQSPSNALKKHVY